MAVGNLREQIDCFALSRLFAIVQNPHLQVKWDVCPRPSQAGGVQPQGPKVT